MTFLQRSKEDAHDYRYFPEPDLIPVVVDEEWKQRVAQRIPELPMQVRARYEDEHGLPEKDARAIVDMARAHGVPIMGASSLRFVDDLAEALGEEDQGSIEGADFFGPMEIQPTQPGLFWYGIHTVEMLYAALGQGCARVQCITDDRRDAVIAQWSDGRVGTIRGWRTGTHQFGGTLHRSAGSRHIQPEIGRPKYVSLADHIINFFRSGNSSVAPEETVETSRFIEAANESRTTGKSVTL